jgi:carboxypeptidase Q
MDTGVRRIGSRKSFREDLMRRALAVLTLALSFAGLTLAATPSISGQDVANLIRSIRSSDAMLNDLRELCDGIGGRPTGSPAAVRSVRWAADKLRAAGVDTVRTEAYDLPEYWESESASASCVAPATFALRIAASPSTGSTSGPIEAELVDFGDGSEKALERVPSSKGKIAFVRTGVMNGLDDLFGDYMRIPALLDAARRTGVSAMLIESSQRRSLLYRHPMSMDGKPLALPVAVVARDHAERITRLMERGPVRVRLQLTAKSSGRIKAENVVAEIRGSDRPEEIVLFGAHLDSWDLGTGALDNGVNAASVIDVARAIKAAGLRPRRTMRFVLFTGEEQGLIGSREYVRAHQAEMKNVVLMVTADIGSGKTTGFYLNGREDLRAPVEQALLPFYPDPKSQSNPIDAIDGTDNFDFLISGAPNLVANQDAVPYLPEYHAESDTLDKVDRAQAKENEAMIAAVLWRFANWSERLPQQTRPEVEQLLVKTQLVDQMKAFLQWDEWSQGKRGLSLK